MARNYIKTHSDLANYYTKDEINENLETLIAEALQDITINDLGQKESIILYGGSASDVMEV